MEGCSSTQEVLLLMGMKTKLAVASVVAAVAAAVGASGASATVTTFSVDDHASIGLNGGALTVTGFIQCTAGDLADVSAIVIQSKGQLLADGFGDTGTFTCTGGLQAWTLAIPASIGTFKPGQASLQATAFDDTDFTSSQSVNQTEHLGK
jgi:hypothetical protein